MNEKVPDDKARGGSMVFSGLVYMGVVLAATTLFISFVLTAFPENAYFSRMVMIIAGLLVGASMLAFPVALHNWAIDGTHRLVTIGLYYAEMLIVMLNTIVSFASLLGKYSGYEVPEWINQYEPFTIVSIVFTLFAWGTVFLLDPSGQAKAQEKAADQRFNKKVATKNLEFLDTVEGEDAVLEAARKQIEKKFGSKRDDGQPKHFGSAAPRGERGASPARSELFSRPMRPAMLSDSQREAIEGSRAGVATRFLNSNYVGRVFCTENAEDAIAAIYAGRSTMFDPDLVFQEVRPLAGHSPNGHNPVG